MNKKLFFATGGAILTVAVSAFFYVNREQNVNSTLFNANVEALADFEQPDINDCIDDPKYHCEALHPTDPSQDKFRFFARW